MTTTTLTPTQPGNYPRVTPEDLKNNIVAVDFVKHVSRTGQVLRWAILEVKNGHAVTGDPSCAVSPENDDQKKGEQIAYENACHELWKLMGYELKSKLQEKALEELVETSQREGFYDSDGAN